MSKIDGREDRGGVARAGADLDKPGCRAWAARPPSSRRPRRAGTWFDPLRSAVHRHRRTPAVTRARRPPGGDRCASCGGSEGIVDAAAGDLCVDHPFPAVPRILEPGYGALRLVVGSMFKMWPTSLAISAFSFHRVRLQVDGQGCAAERARFRVPPRRWMVVASSRRRTENRDRWASPPQVGQSRLVRAPRTTAWQRPSRPAPGQAVAPRLQRS